MGGDAHAACVLAAWARSGAAATLIRLHTVAVPVAAACMHAGTLAADAWLCWPACEHCIGPKPVTPLTARCRLPRSSLTQDLRDRTYYLSNGVIRVGGRRVATNAANFTKGDIVGVVLDADQVGAPTVAAAPARPPPPACRRGRHAPAPGFSRPHALRRGAPPVHSLEHAPCALLGAQRSPSADRHAASPPPRLTAHPGRDRVPAQRHRAGPRARHPRAPVPLCVHGQRAGPDHAAG